MVGEEGTELWETVEVGVEVVMFHLGAARTIAQLGGIYRSNAESKLQGERRKQNAVCLLYNISKLNTNLQKI